MLIARAKHPRLLSTFHRVALWSALALSTTALHANQYVEAESYSGASTPGIQSIRTDDSLASGGSYLIHSGSTTLTEADANANHTAYNFEIREAGTLTIYIRRLWLDNGKNSCYAKIDGVSDWASIQKAEHSRWAWTPLMTVSNVSPGTYTFRYSAREKQTRSDAFFFTTSTNRPVECKALTQGNQIEAEAWLTSSLFGPMTNQTDTTASGGQCILFNSGATNTNTADSTAGRIKYGLTVLEPKSVDVWARVILPSTASDSFFYRLGNGTWQTNTSPVCTRWTWVNLGSFSAAAGLNYVEILGRESGTKFDAVYVSTDGSKPYQPGFYVEAERYGSSTYAAAGALEAQDGGYLSGAASGQSDYSIELGTGANLDIWARLKNSGGAVQYRLDGLTAWQTNTINTAGAWSWTKLGTSALTGGGASTFQIKIPAGTQLDSLYFAQDGSVPATASPGALASGAKFVVPPPVGNDAAAGTATAPWASLNKAAASLSAGQTVYVRGGTYPLASTVKPAQAGTESAWIEYVGFPNENPVIDCSVYWAASSDTPAFSLDGLGNAYTRIRNLEFVNGSQGIICDPYTEVMNCSFRYFYASAIWPTDHNRILSNYVERANFETCLTGVRGSQEGMSTGGYNVEIAYNELCYGGKENIDVKWGGHNVRIHHNYVHDGMEYFNDSGNYPYATGIYIDAAAQEDHIYIYSNVVKNCQNGISLYAEDYSGQTDDLSEIVIRNNILYDNYWSGISVGNQHVTDSWTYNVQILNNTVVGTRYGSWSTGNKGLFIQTYAHDVLARNNIFLSDAVPTDNTASNNITLDSNYTGGYGARTNLFVDSSNGNFNLKAGAAAINAGHADPLYNDPDGTRADQGALYSPQTPTAREIDVRFSEPWNFQSSIASGDTTPSATEGTDFGSINAAYGSLTRTFAIRNAGGAALSVSGVTVSGSHSADFTLGGTTSGTVQPGDSLQLTVTFNPSANGVRTATLSIASDDGNENPYTFAVQGTGITGPAEIDVSYNGTSIADGTTAVSAAAGTDFGSLSLNNSTASRTFVLRNEGGTNLTSIAASITGANAADFSITTAPATSLSGGQTNNLTIRFDPSAGGIRLATVRITSSDADENPYEFAVSGHGIAGPYLQSSTNGLICFEAEGMHRSTTGVLALQDVRWLPYEDATASGQIQMLVPSGATPDSFATSPAMEYDVKFITGGTHYIWVRTHAAASTNGADDSIYVALDNVQIGASFSTYGQLSWGWTKFNTSFSASVGTHTFKVCHREDGVVIDKVVITTSSSYNPANLNSGLGPNVSLTEAVSDAPPEISAQPQSQVVTAGATAVFTVTVSGAAPLSYQWKKNGTNTGSNSDTLSLSNVTTNEAGNYSVVVTNLFGAVTSSVATLTVNPPPPYTLLVEEHFTDLAGTGSTGVTSWPKGTLTNGLAYRELITTGGALAAASTYGNSATFDGTGYADSTLWFSVLVRNTVNQDRLLFFSTGSSSGVGVDFTATQARADISGTMASTAVTITPANTNLIVGKLVLSSSSDETVTIWVNPTNFTSEATLTASAAGSSSVSANGSVSIATNSPIYPRMQGTATVFDEIRLATALAGVTPTSGSQPPPDPYDTWAQSYGLVQAEDGDDDGDGTSNFLEYALRGNPTNSASGAQVEFKAAGTNGFEYIYVRRTTANSGLTYQLETSTNLVSGVWTNSGYTTLPAAVLDANFEILTNRISTVGGAGKFIRLRIAQ
jgi:hypothetical protein